MYKKKFNLTLDHTRDQLLTEFGKTFIRKSYLQDTSITYQEFFARIASSYSDDVEQAQYMYDIMSKLYFLPATPTLANGKYAGTDNKVGLPISCFLNEAQNNKDSLQRIMNEVMSISHGDGGVGTYWSNLAATGEELDGQESWGILPFLKTSGELTRYFGGKCRKTGSGCSYLKVDHPQIEEFIQSRKPQVGTDQSTVLSRHVHIGVTITDVFLDKVKNKEPWDLVSPITGKVIKTIDAQTLWKKILTMRVETGEPFLIFIDNVNKNRPDILKKLNIEIKTSNLCTEIVLPTGIDHQGKNRTSICCLGSVNLRYFDEIQQDPKFFYYIGKFLDNIRLDFIARAPESLKDAVYATIRDGSIGLGVSGFSTYLQEKGLEYGEEVSKKKNIEIFEYIKKEMDLVSYKLACERGPCEDGKEVGIMERFTHKIALKPDALTSYIFNVSSNIEPMAPAYMYTTMYGSYLIKNPILEDLLKSRGYDNDVTWNRIVSMGTVNDLSILSEKERKIFKNPYETDQMTLVQMACERGKYICQAQSLNLFFKTPIDAKELINVHLYGAKNGIKSFYYCRTTSKFSIENNEIFRKQSLKINIKQDNETSIVGSVCEGCD